MNKDQLIELIRLHDAVISAYKMVWETQAFHLEAKNKFAAYLWGLEQKDNLQQSNCSREYGHCGPCNGLPNSGCPLNKDLKK